MSKIRIIFLVAMILLALGGGLYIFWYRTITPTSAPLLTVAENTNQVSAPEKVVTPATKQANPLFGTPNFGSENFRIGDVSIGGESEFLLAEDTPDPLAVSEIRGEAFTEKNKSEVRLIITWKTNKLAKSEISYSKGVGQSKKTVNEDDFTMNHSLIIQGLDQASTYFYTLVTQDRFGNEVTSDQYALYTGTKTVSLFDLIAGAVSDVFGWAVKK